MTLEVVEYTPSGDEVQAVALAQAAALRLLAEIGLAWLRAADTSGSLEHSTVTEPVTA